MKQQRPYWNMEAEVKLNTADMEEIQWAKLKKKLDYLYNRTSYWKAWMDKAGGKPENIKTWDDFRKTMPIFTKENYREYAEHCDGNMGKILEGLMGDDAKRLTLVAATSGTTGDPQPYPFTAEDLKAFCEVFLSTILTLPLKSIRRAECLLADSMI